MKKSYIKILILEVVLVLIMLFNNFVINNSNVYLLICILLIGLLILKFMLGHEKTNYWRSKDIVLNIIIYTILVLLLTYILGIFISFSRTPNYWNISGITKYIIPTVLIIIISEILRFSLIQKSEGSKILIIFTTIFFVVIDLILKINTATFISSYSTFIFITYYLLPSIAKNILCVYICRKVGYKPAITYRLIMETYTYFIPLIPDFGDYINSMVRLLIPSILIFILIKILKEEPKEEIIYFENTIFDKINYVLIILLVTICIYLTSGNFRYFTMAIGSGSMRSKINKGDMIIIKKLEEEEKTKVKKGDILVYRYGSTVIVHRIVDIYSSANQFIVYTKGDANEEMDNYPIDTKMMIGVVKTNIPLIGYPTILLNNYKQ